MEIYGHNGSMIVPDPNFFSGDIMISKCNSEWIKINNDNMLLGIPNTIDNDGKKIANYRGIGLSDMIYSIENKKTKMLIRIILACLRSNGGYY